MQGPLLRMLKPHVEIDRLQCRTFGIDQGFLPQAKRARLLVEAGLTAQDITRGTIETLAGRAGVEVPEPSRQPLGE